MSVTFLTAQAIKALLGTLLGPLAHSCAKCKASHLGTGMSTRETVQMFADTRNFPQALLSPSVHLNINLSLPSSLTWHFQNSRLLHVNVISRVQMLQVKAAGLC